MSDVTPPPNVAIVNPASPSVDPASPKSTGSVGTISSLQDLKNINYMDENGVEHNAYRDLMNNMGIAAANECKKNADHLKKVMREYKSG